MAGSGRRRSAESRIYGYRSPVSTFPLYSGAAAGGLRLRPRGSCGLPVHSLARYMTPVSPTSSTLRPVFRTSRALGGPDAPLPDPARFLAGFEGRPRGFWGRADRWVAWGDALAEVVVEDRGGGGGGGGGDRFERLRAVLSAHDGALGPPPRLFGGFSFLDDPAPNGSWSEFPRARFVLPRVMLEAGPEGATLSVQGFADAEHEDELDAWVRSLRADPDAAAPRVPPEPLPPVGERAVERGEEAWTAAVEAVLAAERAGSVDKAVLARTRDVTLPSDASIPDLLRFLRHENRRAHVFVFEPVAGCVLFGAAPEVLAELRDGRFHATAVAGSAPRGRTTHEEQLFAGGLLASPKDRAEHRMTVEEMVEVLTPRMRSLRVPAEPGVLTLARIQHLESPIEGEAGAGEDILSLVQALHPTPAVCGRPRAEALELIRQAEPFERGWYAGPVGWFDAAGDGDFVPALRVGVGGGRRWRLYAGAGIVEGSDPHSEWEETALKFEPAHRALRAATSAADVSAET
jgi:menaquinone-specific isochorismate synthase